MDQVALWVVLHSGHGGPELPFQVAFWGLVGLLVLAGVLQYAGVFESSEDPSEEDEPTSGAGD